MVEYPRKVDSNRSFQTYSDSLEKISQIDEIFEDALHETPSEHNPEDMKILSDLEKKISKLE